jgi:hypothetical protein
MGAKLCILYIVVVSTPTMYRKNGKHCAAVVWLILDHNNSTEDRWLAGIEDVIHTVLLTAYT